jgi:hypothetical protein
MIGQSVHTDGRESAPILRAAAKSQGSLVNSTGAESELEAVLQAYADEIRRCRYGSFRGVIKDGKVVIFALEHEWRPHLDRQQGLHREVEANSTG